MRLQRHAAQRVQTVHLEPCAKSLSLFLQVLIIRPGAPDHGAAGAPLLVLLIIRLLFIIRPRAECYIRYNYEFWVFILMQKFQDGDAKNLLLENEDTLVEFDRGAGT